MARCKEQVVEATKLVNDKAEEVIAFLSNKSLEEAQRLAPILNQRHFYGHPVISVPKAIGTTPVVKSAPAQITEAIESKIVDDEKFEMEERIAELEAGMNYDIIDMPMKTYNKFNYQNVLNNKTLIIKKLEAQRNLIKNKESTKEQLRQVEWLNETIRKLIIDVSNLKEEAESLPIYIASLQKDVRNIEALLQNPTVDNIQAIGTYLEILDRALKDSNGNSFVMQATDTIRENNPEIYAQLEPLMNNIGMLKKDQEAAQIRLTKQMIRHHLKQQKETANYEDEVLDEAVQKTYDAQFKSHKEMMIGLAYVTGMEEHEESNVIVSALYKIYADALTRNNMKKKRKALDDIKDDVKRELIKLGHKTGELFREVADQSVFLRKNIGTHQLIGKFSAAWVDFDNKLKAEANRVARILYKPNKSVLEIERINNHFKILSDNVDFFDVNFVPEIITNTEFADFSSFFGDIKQAEQYRTDLIAKIGQREYDKLVAQQKTKIQSYIIFREVREARMLEREEMAKKNPSMTYDAEAAMNTHLHMLYSKNPFVFAKHYKEKGTNQINKHYFVKGEKRHSTTPADLEFSSYSPKHSNHFDSDFQIIEDSSVLKEAWGIMADLVEFNNQNGFNDKPNNLNEYSLASQSKKLMQFPLKDIGLMSRNVLDKFLSVFYTGRYRAENVDHKVTGGRNTVDKMIEDLYKRKIRQLSNPSKQEKETALKEAKETIMRRQDTNIMDNILTATEMTEVFKAKREIEAEVKFLRNQLKAAPDRAAFKKIVDFFINKEFYGINNRQHWSALGVPDIEGKMRFFNANERVLRKESKKYIKDLKARLAEVDSEDTDLISQIESEIQSQQDYIESGGKVITAGSVSEAALIKATRVVAFSVNFGAQVTNKMIADVNAWEVDGREGFWDAGAYHDAKSFSRLWKEYAGGKKTREQIRVADLLLQRLGVFQNSANEIFKIEKSKAKNAFIAILSNPMNLVSEVEKTIQRPQILAMLSTIDIKGVDSEGNPITVKMWDRTTRSFPAFKEVDGQLELAEGFDSQENIDTYLLNNSQEYANNFGDAGTVPRNIAFINGDYRGTSTYLFEKNFLPALMMLFKRWSVATMKKKFGMYKSLGENKSGDLATISTLMKGGAVSFAAGAIFGPLGGIVGLSALAISQGRKAYKKKLEADKIHATEAGLHLRNAQVQVSLGNHLSRAGMASVNLAMASVAQSLSMIISPFTGKQYINSDQIKRIMNVKKLNKLGKVEVTDKQVRQIEDDLYFLTTSVSATLSFLAARALVMLALYPDDDEEKKHKARVAGGDSFWERMVADPDTAMYYTLENMLSGFIQDANMLFNLGGLVREGDIFGLKKMGILHGDVEQILQGNSKLKSGENEGKNRFWVHLGKYYTPAALKDWFSMGFGSKSKRDYNTQNYIDQVKRPVIEKINSARLEARKEMKEKLLVSPEFKYLDEREKTRQVNNRLAKLFPVIRDEYMTKKGKPKSEYKYMWKSYYKD